MIELAVVVTARLHAHPQLGRDEGMPQAPDIAGCHHLDERGPKPGRPCPSTRSETTQLALTNQVPATDVTDSVDVCFDAPALRASGPDQPRPRRTHRLTAPHSTGMPFWAGPRGPGGVVRRVVRCERGARSRHPASLTRGALSRGRHLGPELRVPHWSVPPHGEPRLLPVSTDLVHDPSRTRELGPQVRLPPERVGVAPGRIGVP